MRTAVPPAPIWHTALLIATIVGVAIVGSALSATGTAPPPPADASSRLTTVYVPMLLVQWGLVLYVCRIGRTRGVFRELVGRTWDGPARAAIDVALAVTTAFWIIAVNVAYTHLLGGDQGASAAAVLPQTRVERAAWVVVALSTGFCEEVVYRGYLRTALWGLSGSVTFGVMAQGALFGLAHVDQGFRAAIAIAFYGVLLGAVAQFRGSLVAGILCHALVDLLSGF